MKMVKAFGRTLSQQHNHKRDESVEKPWLDLLKNATVPVVWTASGEE